MKNKKLKNFDIKDFTRYDKLGRISKHGNYDQYGNKLKPFFTIKKLIQSIKDFKQKRMIIPTDPKEIKRRANLIRLEIQKQKNQRLELSELNKDLDLIKYHARITGKLKHDDRDYSERREDQDTKENLDI